MESVRPFQFGTHVLHIVLSFLTLGGWVGVYWWRYHVARLRYQEDMLMAIAEAVQRRDNA